MNKLLESTNNNTPEFSLGSMVLQGCVLSCYDADTCTIALPLFDNIFKFTCRLNGIDTPEMKPRKDKIGRDNEIIWAKKARAELLKMVCNENVSYLFDNLDIKKEEINKILEENKKIITVKCNMWDKYGRLLVDLYNNEDTLLQKSFNNMLVEKNMAVAYNGGTKITPW
jgi:endonuclease YncB( thermonuclease family)